MAGLLLLRSPHPGSGPGSPRPRRRPVRAHPTFRRAALHPETGTEPRPPDGACAVSLKRSAKESDRYRVLHDTANSRPRFVRYDSLHSDSFLLLPSGGVLLDRPALRQSPLPDQVQFCLRQSRLPMSPNVLGRRHQVSLRRCYNRREITALLIPGVVVPSGEVHECATAHHVTVNLPRDRRDVGIPRPDCIFGMTVLTGTLQNRSHRCRHGRSGQQGLNA